jgi:NAD kinase
MNAQASPFVNRESPLPVWQESPLAQEKGPVQKNFFQGVEVKNIILVTNKTRLEQLIERFNTKAQAKFYIEHSGGNFQLYENEHNQFYRALEGVTKKLGALSKWKLVEKKFLPNFIFSETDAVVVLGQDGLVANTAKYAKSIPLMGVNPDPALHDGLLLPFQVNTIEQGLIRVLENNFASRWVTMAQAKTHDGQTLLAFNDLFIGPASHTSARYKIIFNGIAENQSSSGIIVSTGAGSTGWLSSAINMTNGISKIFQHGKGNLNVTLKPDEDKLAFVVREPFQSKHSTIAIAAGIVDHTHTINLESHMPCNGVIFSDGIESDFLQFNSGCSVEIAIAKEKARMVQSCI